jgi:tetratricopeptide (TPR) repeat protein
MTTLSKSGFGFIRAGCLVLLTFTALLRPALAVDSNAPPGVISTQDFLRSFLQLQEQLHDTQLAMEKNRQEAAATAASNALVMEARLQLMEKTDANERLEQLHGIERLDRTILMAAGAFAAIGFLVLLVAAFLQWTALNRLAAAHSSKGLDVGEAPWPSGHAMEQSSARFLGLIERLEQRIRELETSAKPPQTLSENNFGNGGAKGPAAESSSGEIPPAAVPDKAGTIHLLLGKSQTLLKLDKPDAALECLDEVLALDSKNPDALVKKGAVLERLHRFEEAIQYYDLAIAEDSSMTMAYLYKGGVFNRLERHSEALACYEQALKPGKTPRAQTSASK